MDASRLKVSAGDLRRGNEGLDGPFAAAHPLARRLLWLPAMRALPPIHCAAPRFQASEADEARAVRVTLLCADIVGFSEMSERLGDRALLGVMRRVANMMRSEVRNCHGELIEIRGDGFLMAFEQPRDALWSALQIERSLRLEPERYRGQCVRIRMAVHTGEALRDGGGYFGRNVIVPHRVLDRVGAGAIGVTAEAEQGLPAEVRAGLGRFRFRPKGLSQDVSYVLVDATQLARAAGLEPSVDDTAVLVPRRAFAY
jgi:class 3 adenylate cyclase